jgi:hypothetical protein
MSAHNDLNQIRQVEETLYGVIRHELDSRAAEFCAAGLQVALDPIYRSGEGSNYASYVEVTLQYTAGDVHDIVFFYVARSGRLMVDTTAMQQWITQTLDESIRKASGTRNAADERRIGSE